MLSTYIKEFTIKTIRDEEKDPSANGKVQDHCSWWGLNILNDHYKLKPDAISGVCSSSPLHIRELSTFTDIPVFNSVNPDRVLLKKLLLKTKGQPRNKKAA